jgi:hypothetical protein
VYARTDTERKERKREEKKTIDKPEQEGRLESRRKEEKKREKETGNRKERDTVCFLTNKNAMYAYMLILLPMRVRGRETEKTG